MVANKRVLAYISTRGRYDTTLLAAISAIINQTLVPTKFILFDDNDKPRDLRQDENYLALFRIMELKGIEWEVIFGKSKGQHYNHQIANTMDFDWCWRVDDDVIVDSTSLAHLLNYAEPTVGAVGGAVITPNFRLQDSTPRSGRIEDLYSHANIQWFPILKRTSVDHLHCSFLYRPNIVPYNLKLSRVAHREETLFTYDLKKSGYELLVVPGVTAYHLKSAKGGIRDGAAQLYQHDEEIFRQNVSIGKLVVLDSGIGDHIMFKSILPEMKERYGRVTIACCYPYLFEGEETISIAQAATITDISEYNIYKKCAEWNWTGHFVDAFRKLYL